MLDLKFIHNILLNNDPSHYFTSHAGPEIVHKDIQIKMLECQYLQDLLQESPYLYLLLRKECCNGKMIKLN